MGTVRVQPVAASLKGDIEMIRKLVVTAGLAALLAAAIGGGAFASASGSDGMPRTITVIGKQASGQFVDIGKKGPSAGDEFILMNGAPTSHTGSATSASSAHFWAATTSLAPSTCPSRPKQYASEDGFALEQMPQRRCARFARTDQHTI
jgi:hypothetical protein